MLHGGAHAVDASSRYAITIGRRKAFAIQLFSGLVDHDFSYPSVRCGRLQDAFVTWDVVWVT